MVDLRELNKLIPHGTYEPPSCDACLEWLAGKPFRTTLDLLHGFHGVLLCLLHENRFEVHRRQHGNRERGLVM